MGWSTTQEAHLDEEGHVVPGDIALAVGHYVQAVIVAWVGLIQPTVPHLSYHSLRELMISRALASALDFDHDMMFEVLLH